jgi:hypothetical protein
MKRISRLLAYPVMALSALGLLASFFLSLAALGAKLNIDRVMLRVAFPGIFVVWVPAILLMNQLSADFKQRDIWKAALRGCPVWMRTALWTMIGVTFTAFLAPFLWGSRPENFPPSFFLVASVFYSISFCVAYSFLHVEQFDAGRRCLNGHRISPVAKFCEECGAPAGPDVVQPPRAT